jgi:acetyl-CoA carboxylase biotin carboxyl carrier protein
MRSIPARVSTASDGSIQLDSPVVGWWEAPPRDGEILGPGSSIGTVRQLHRRYRITLPDGVAGRVERAPHDRLLAVSYGERLITMKPLEDAGDAAGAGSTIGTSASADADVAAGMTAVRSPTDGVFYRSPSPGAPPFVEVGARVRQGQAVGLVEVMKTFNQILYGEADGPAEAEVVELRCDDGDEIATGQILMVLR